MMRILVADDHETVRRGLIKLMGDQPEITVVGEASNGEEAVQLARLHQPDVVLMDINMPVMNGFTATRILKSEFPKMRIIGLSVHGVNEYRCEMMNAGASACYIKGEPINSLIDLLRPEPGGYPGSSVLQGQ